MDFESAFDQILTILSHEPEKVYTSFYYRKQTKNQWARDDPAFSVVEGAFVAISALAYAIAFKHPPSIWGYLWAIFYSVLIDWLLVGIVVSSICRSLSNRFLRLHHSHSEEQEVEAGFAWDVHANSFLGSFLITHVLQYFFLPILLSRSFLACFLSSALYCLSIVLYFYLTHLGYRALPFLAQTQLFFWYPLLASGLGLGAALLLLVLGFRLNPSRIVMAFHYG